MFFRYASRIDGFFSKKGKKPKKIEKKGLHFPKSHDILSNVPSEQVNTTRGISTVGRTKFSEVHPTSKAVNGESAQNSPGIFGALAQLVARYIRIVEVSGSNPLCSTKPKKSEHHPGWGWVRISSFYLEYCGVISKTNERRQIGIIPIVPALKNNDRARTHIHRM